MTCNKNNLTARKLYESKGFAATGNEDEDEIELAMTVSRQFHNDTKVVCEEFEVVYPYKTY